MAVAMVGSCTVGAEARPVRDEAAPPAASSIGAEPPEVVRPLVGTFRFTGGATERDALTAAIEEVVSEVNPLIRGVVRDRLTESCTIPTALDVAADGATITVRFDGRAYTAELDAPAVTVTGISGNELSLTHRMDGSQLVQRFDGDRGGRVNRLARKQKKLRMSVRVHSSQLPRDLTYDLTFGPTP